MTNDEILTALGVSGATDENKAALLENINTVVEMRAVGALSDVMTDEDVSHLESMEKGGASKKEMLDWLSANVANAEEMIVALTRDYVAEMSEKYK